MLDYLLGGPVVDFVDLRDEQLVFRCRRHLAVGREVPVRVCAGEGRTVPLKVTVQNTRPLDSGGFACTGEVRDDFKLPALAQLKECSSGMAVDSALRQQERLDCHIRVWSTGIAGFKAISVDFHTGGLQIETQAPMEPGSVMDLTMELDLNNLGSVQCRARVAWCAPRSKNAYRAGLQFMQLEPSARQQLDRYERFLRTRGEAKILQRLVYCDDHYLTDSQPPAAECAAPAPVRPATEDVRGLVESYTVVAGRVELTFRKSEDGKRFKFHFEGYRGLVDHAAAAGCSQDREVEKFCRKPSSGCTRFQFLDRWSRVSLEVIAASCELTQLS